MIKVILSPDADCDLALIWQYIGMEKGNDDAARRILNAIRNTLKLLPEFPELGDLCDEFQSMVPGIRKLAVSGFVIYYRFHEDKPNTVEVGRVLHARQDRQRAIGYWCC